MPDLVRIDANWALWGKHPGSQDDYSVLSCSTGPFSRTDFSTILSRFTPGTPSASVNSVGALPWVTVSWISADDEFHLGIAVQAATDNVDGAGRPIIQTSCFLVPYGGLAAGPVSYTSLYQTVAQLRLPSDSALIPLMLPRLDPQELARTIENVGELAVATTTGLLLRGPVSIVRAETSTLLERLCFIEAVAALLPYGYRANYTAATWSDSRSQHRIRLAFAERPRDGAQPVDWREPGKVPADDSVVQGYLRQLGRLRGWPPGHPRAIELPAIIAHLAGDSQPRTFDQPQPAIASLRDFDFPSVMISPVVHSPASPADVRRLSLSRVMELPADGRLALLETLIGFGDPEDWPTIRVWFDPIAGDNPGAMLPVLARTARRLLWTSAPSRVVRDALTLAANYGLEDALLAEIVRPPAEAADLRDGLPRAAQLLNDCVIADDRTQRHPETLAVLSRNPLVACELLAQLAGSQAHTDLAIRWLAAALPEQVAPFAAVLTDNSGPIDQQMIGQLAGSGLECVRALLQAASRVHRLDLALTGFLRWLSSRSEFSVGDQRYWHDCLWAFELDDVATRAGVDLALLAVSSSPRSLLVVAGQSDWPAYSEYFTSVWSTLGVPGGRGAERLGATLGDYLCRVPWASDMAQATAIVDLIRRLPRSQDRQALIVAVASILSALPDTARWPAVRDWLAEVNRDDPGTPQDGSVISLRGLQPGTAPERIAALCLRACHDGVHPDIAAIALAKSGVVDSGLAAVTVLQELRSAFRAADFYPRQKRSWLQEFETGLVLYAASALLPSEDAGPSGGYVFISYTAADSESVDQLQHDLESSGVTVWRDRSNLGPGDRWKDSIRRAIASGGFFLCCFSEATAKLARSYMNEELTVAVEELRLRNREQIWFLPVVFPGGEVPAWPIGAGETLRDLNYTFLSPDTWFEGIRKLVQTIRKYQS